jgi:hypothetical protein
MCIAVRFFREARRAMAAVPRLQLLVDLLDVLLDVAALAERFVAPGFRAAEGLDLGVGAHVVNEFRPVGHNFVAGISKFALEQSL